MNTFETYLESVGKMKIYPGDSVKILKYEGGAPSGKVVKVASVDHAGGELTYTFKGDKLKAGLDKVQLVLK